MRNTQESLDHKCPLKKDGVYPGVRDIVQHYKIAQWKYSAERVSLESSPHHSPHYAVLGQEVGPDDDIDGLAQGVRLRFAASRVGNRDVHNAALCARVRRVLEDRGVRLANGARRGEGAIGEVRMDSERGACGETGERSVLSVLVRKVRY